VITAALILALQAATAAAAPTPVVEAPSPVVERVVRFKERTLRLTLFDNREAVVSVREHGHQVLARRRLLAEPVYVGYVAATTADRAALEKLARSTDVLREGGRGRISIFRPGEAPLIVRYSTLQAHDLVLGRLVAALDDLEKYVLETNPSFDAMKRWVPHVGDRVELVNGQTATVIEVKTNHVIVIEYDDVPVVEAIAPPQRSLRIVALLGPKP